MSEIRIESGKALKEELLDLEIGSDLRKTLEKLQRQAKIVDNPVLLAFADDGLIWGEFDGDSLFIARDADEKLGPILRWETIQRIHLFNKEKELRIWRQGSEFKAAVLSEDSSNKANYFDEKQVLFGTRIKEGLAPVSVGNSITFTPIEDLAGQWHVPPVGITELSGGNRPLRLKLRNYLQAESATGMLKVHASRIIQLFMEEV